MNISFFILSQLMFLLGNMLLLNLFHLNLFGMAQPDFEYSQSIIEFQMTSQFLALEL